MSSLQVLRRSLRPALRTAQQQRSLASFAKMTIIGRLGDTPEIVATSTGREIIKYVVATNSGPKDNQQTSWFRVTSFPREDGGAKDFMAGLDKGTLVYLEGEAKMDTYQDSEGKTRSSLSLIQRRLEVLSPRKESSD